MLVRGRSVQRRVGQAVAKQRQREGRGMRAAVDPDPPKEQRAAEGMQGPEPASAPVPGSKTEAELAAAPHSKRKRADDNAENGEVVDFCDIFPHSRWATTWSQRG